jgi:acyl carrier protein
MPTNVNSISEIEDRIRNSIVSSFLDEEQAGAFRNDDDLLQILDSLQILRLLVELESHYQFKVDNSELLPENLATVEKLAAFVTRKVFKGA